MILWDVELFLPNHIVDGILIHYSIHRPYASKYAAILFPDLQLTYKQLLLSLNLKRAVEKWKKHWNQIQQSWQSAILSAIVI